MLNTCRYVQVICVNGQFASPFQIECWSSCRGLEVGLRIGCGSEGGGECSDGLLKFPSLAEGWEAYPRRWGRQRRGGYWW